MSSEVVSAVAFVIASVLGLVFIRRHVPLEKLIEHHEVAGVCFAVVGGLYGIILAFVLVSSWERYEAARAQTEIEASAAGDLYRHADGLSEPTRSQLQAAIVEYTQSVITDEWPAMDEGHASDATQALYFAVWRSLMDARPTEEWQVALYQSSLEKLDDFADGRRNRIFYMQSGLPEVIWVFLLAFGVATVCFTYFFGMPRLLPQIVITIVLAATLAWSLALVSELQTPFSGAVRVDDRAFRVALEFMQRDSLQSRRGH